MSIRITCPDCRATYAIGDDLQGRKVLCRDCGRRIVVDECLASGDDLAEVEVVDADAALQKEPRPPVRNSSRREARTPDVRKRRWSSRRILLAVAAMLLAGGGTVGAAYWYDWFGLAIYPIDPNPVVMTKLIHHLRSGDPSRVRMAALRLSRMAPNERRREVAAALEARLNDPHPFIEDEVADALGVWGDEENVPALIKAMDRPLGNRSALRALTRFRDDRTIEALAVQLENFFNRRDAAQALRSYGPAAEDAVIACLKHHDRAVRGEACEILMAIGTAKSIAPLEKVVAENDFFVTRKANEALQAIRRRE